MCLSRFHRNEQPFKFKSYLPLNDNKTCTLMANGTWAGKIKVCYRERAVIK